MKINILAKRNDDITFTRIISQVLNDLIFLTKPIDVFVIQINHRFDYKWLTFSHKVLGELGVWHNDELRIPPFVPEKVIEESYFQLKHGNYFQKEFVPLHIQQNSQENAHRKIKLFSTSGIFLWYSGNSSIHSQASLMVYTRKNAIESCWYVAFNKNKSWKISGNRNISINELKSLTTDESIISV